MVLEVEKTRLHNTGETQRTKMFLNLYLTIWDWSDAMRAATLLTLMVYVCTTHNLTTSYTYQMKRAICLPCS